MAKRNNYFDETYYMSLVLQYKKIDPEDRKSPESERLGAAIWEGAHLIAKAIFFRHKFGRFVLGGADDVDFLILGCANACFEAVDRFDPTFVNSKGKGTTLFNYWSLTAKRYFMFETKRQQKYRNTYSLDDSSKDNPAYFQHGHERISNDIDPRYIYDDAAIQRAKKLMNNRIDIYINRKTRPGVKFSFNYLIDNIFYRFDQHITRRAIYKEIRENAPSGILVENRHIRTMFHLLEEDWETIKDCFQPIRIH